MLELFLVGAGGSVGACTRYFISASLARRYGAIFPFGTLAVNLLGTFILAGLAGLLSRGLLADWYYRELIGVGFCGGLTTFSTFSNETFELLREQKIRLALLGNIGSNIILCLVATVVGFWLGAGSL